MIAHRFVLNGLAHPLHNTCGFMARHHRQRRAELPLYRFQVGVAQAGGFDSYQNIAVAQVSDFHCLDVKRGPCYPQDGGIKGHLTGFPCN